MKSYASIDRIEGKYAICELEMVDVVESRTTDFFRKETIMVEILLENLFNVLYREPNEGDIIVIDHEGEIITNICCEDMEEKDRRIEQINAIIGK